MQFNAVFDGLARTSRVESVSRIKAGAGTDGLSSLLVFPQVGENLTLNKNIKTSKYASENTFALPQFFT